MKQMIKIFFSVMLFIGLQSVLGQDGSSQSLSSNIYQAIADSGYDMVIRLDKEMNEAEINSLTDVLRSFVPEIEISYTRDESGTIKTLKSSGGPSSGYCASDDFDFLIIAIKDNKWKGCRISDRSKI